MMRKLIAMMLAAMTLVCLCTAAWAEADSDLAYVQGKGKLLVGITEFEPMDYRDADGSWCGLRLRWGELSAFSPNGRQCLCKKAG